MKRITLASLLLLTTLAGAGCTLGHSAARSAAPPSAAQATAPSITNPQPNFEVPAMGEAYAAVANAR